MSQDQSSPNLDERGERTAANPTSRGLLVVALVAAGLIASLASFGIGEATYGLYRWNDARDVIAAHQNELNRLGPYERNAFITRKMTEARTVVESRRAAIGIGALGGLLGLALALAGGWVARDRHRATRGGLVGLILGAGAGAAMGLVCVPLFYQFLTPGGGLAVPILCYAGLLLPATAVGALAFSIGVGQKHALASSVLAALLGGAVAVVVLVMVNSLAFPLDQEPALIPGDRPARLVIHVSLALCVALFVALGLARAPVEGRFRAA